VLLSPACASLDMFPQLHAPWRGFASAVQRAAHERRRRQPDAQRAQAARTGDRTRRPVVLALSLVLLGLVMVTRHRSRSPVVTATVRVPGAPAAAGADRGVAPAVTLSRSERAAAATGVAAAAAGACALLVVLVPGLVTWSTAVAAGCDWRAVNFPVSEAARVLALIYVASYAVRYEDELRGGLPGLLKPLALLAGLRCCCCWSRTSCRQCAVITGFGVCVLAGARWRWMFDDAACRRGCMTLAGAVL